MSRVRARRAHAGAAPCRRCRSRRAGRRERTERRRRAERGFAGRLALAPSPAAACGICFGELHAHTGLSDGSGSAAGADASGRAAGLDFFTVSDHHDVVAPWKWAATEAAADEDVIAALPGPRWRATA